MSIKAARVARPIPPPPQPADLVLQWTPGVRAICGLDAELDYSFALDAITICDMRIPSALRTSILYHRRDLQDGLHKLPGDLERRVSEFMR